MGGSVWKCISLCLYSEKPEGIASSRKGPHTPPNDVSKDSSKPDSTKPSFSGPQTPPGSRPHTPTDSAPRTPSGLGPRTPPGTPPDSDQDDVGDSLDQQRRLKRRSDSFQAVSRTPERRDRELERFSRLKHRRGDEDARWVLFSKEFTIFRTNCVDAESMWYIHM